MLAAVLLASCIVPARAHLTGIIVGNAANPAAYAERIKREGFTTVATSIPPHDTQVGFKDIPVGPRATG